jgi:hypothetical protein
MLRPVVPAGHPESQGGKQHRGDQVPGADVVRGQPAEQSVRCWPARIAEYTGQVVQICASSVQPSRRARTRERGARPAVTRSEVSFLCLASSGRSRGYRPCRPSTGRSQAAPRPGGSSGLRGTQVEAKAMPHDQRDRAGALSMPGAPAGRDDLGLHRRPRFDVTMLRLMPLRPVHHRCTCWHRGASGSSHLHLLHHRRLQ